MASVEGDGKSGTHSGSISAFSGKFIGGTLCPGV